MKFLTSQSRFDDLLGHLKTIEQEHDKALKEIKMWREFYISQYFLIGEEEYQLVKKIVNETPIGIEDIKGFIEKKLEGYRDTQEKNS